MSAHQISSEEQEAEERKAQRASTATDKVKGIPHSLLKPVYGAEGVRTFVTPGAPFPVTVSVTSGGGGGGGGAGGSPKYARINLGTTTSTEIVAAVVGKKIRVVSVWLIYHGAGAFTIGFLSATTNIAGPYLAPPTLPFILVPDADGYFETVANEALMLKPSNATVLGGSLVYIEV